MKLLLGDVLVARNYLDPDQLRQAMQIQKMLHEQKGKQVRLGDILVKMGKITSTQLTEALELLAKQREKTALVFIEQKYLCNRLCQWVKESGHYQQIIPITTDIQDVMLRIHEQTELLIARYPLPEIRGVGFAQLLKQSDKFPNLIILVVVSQGLDRKDRRILEEQVHKGYIDAVLDSLHSKNEATKAIEFNRYKRMFPHESVKKAIKVQQISAVQSSETIESAMQLALSQPELQMIPVTKGETFLGWVDTKVLLNPTHWGEDRNKPVSSIMKPSSSDIAIDLSTNIAEAIDKFSSSPTSALFVCEGERLAGVVYPRNMLQYMKENMQKKVE